jgi:hypothetical protein
VQRKTSLVALFMLAALTLGRGQQGIRRASERVVLSKANNGVDGWLRIASDARLTAEMENKIWGVGLEIGLEDRDPLKKSLSAKPLENARLEIVDSHERVIESDQLERPLAKIEQARLDSGDDTFLVTVHYSIGLGSYAGPTTSLLQVHNGRINWLKAIDADSHKDEPIHLAKTLKSGWKFLSTGGKKDILQVLCRPDVVAGGNRDFHIEYVRYRLRSGVWIKYARTEKGLWESDEGFPALSKFRK